MEFFLSPNVAVFSGVLVAVAALCVLELVSTMLAGGGVSHLLDTLVDTNSLPDSTLTNWLLIKDVPLMVALTTLLTGFGATGMAVQATALTLLGSTAPPLISMPLAVGGAVLLLRALSSTFKKLKVVNSTALAAYEFIGQRVALLSPTASKAMMGEAKFTDRHGLTHYVMVRPADEETFAADDVLELLEPTGGGYLARRVKQ